MTKLVKLIMYVAATLSFVLAAHCLRVLQSPESVAYDIVLRGGKIAEKLFLLIQLPEPINDYVHNLSLEVVGSGGAWWLGSFVVAGIVLVWLAHRVRIS